ncbi:hypothetical protein Baya_15950 [Bagarius yarrelli]|uniref:Uncharacterized protein n=1 Tax=Bagarius yarrelli TaxID=175774 RepID=A0A556VTZ1_BAGYA|nr:hypothetical protein Baya_15950 [Bagarius yarrelli]
MKHEGDQEKISFTKHKQSSASERNGLTTVSCHSLTPESLLTASSFLLRMKEVIIKEEDEAADGGGDQSFSTRPRNLTKVTSNSRRNTKEESGIQEKFVR